MKAQAQAKRRFGPSTVAELQVVRTSEMGAFLDAQTGSTSDDILLHKTQQTAPVAVGDTVRVFLYLDPKGRLTASMRVPQMKEGQIARLKVLHVTKDGAFVDAGAERGIFMPHAGMRGKVQPGEIVWAKLYTDKSGRLAVTMEVEDEMRRASRPAEGLRIGDTVRGAVYNLTDRGAFLLTEDRCIAFLDQSEMRERPRVGQELEARVTFVREDGRINVSTRPLKEKALVSDADAILAFLQARGGRMPYSDDTAPEIVRAKFQLSKAAFKRALGHLMREGKIEQKDGWTSLKEAD